MTEDALALAIIVFGRLPLLVMSYGAVDPALGVETVREEQAVSPAAFKVLELRLLDMLFAMFDAALLVVVTVNATLTEDCNRWRPVAAVTEVMATCSYVTEAPRARMTAFLN